MTGRTELAGRLAERLGGHQVAAGVLTAVLEEIEAALAAGERVTLTGFGTFEAVPRAARAGRNPRTGESVEIGATTAVRFRAGTRLRTSVASGQVPRTTPAPEIPDDAPVRGRAVARAAAEAQPADAAKVAVPPKKAGKAADRDGGSAKKHKDAKSGGKGAKQKDAKSAGKGSKSGGSKAGGGKNAKKKAKTKS